MNEVYNKIVLLLTEKGITFTSIQHVPTYTSEESAVVRGEPIECGAKAILIKTESGFYLIVMSAAKKIDSKKVKAVTGVKKMRFANAEELFAITGLVPGSVPPFGKPVLPVDLIIDTSITQLTRVAFNAGSLQISIMMSAADYLKAAAGTVTNIT
jgi:Ala-tRNA(Pro) deacylase